MSESTELSSFSDGTAPSNVDANSSGEADSSDKQESNQYGTPRSLIRRLQQAIGGEGETLFDLDPTSGAEPKPIAETRYTKEVDGLSQPWALPSIDTIYLNPPYSNPEPFLRKLKTAIDPEDPSAASLGISLTKSDTSTDWFHEHIAHGAKVVCFPDSRLSFYGGEQGAKFPNAIGVFGDPPEELLESLSEIGELYSRVEVENALEQQRLEDLVSDGGCVAAIPVDKSASSDDYPATAHTSLDFIDPHDTIEIAFDTDSLGARHRNIPEEVHLSVLPDGKEIDPETGTISINTAGQTPDGTDVCVNLRNSAGIASHLEVNMAVGAGGWELVTPQTVNVIDN